MPSNVSVPANFGRDQTKESSHNNLTFNLPEGNKIIANSIIMALNSPVIADLTAVSRLTSIDATEFSMEAVNCFVKASYTGRLESVTSTNVADVIEMGRVFQVSWLVAKCEKFLNHKLGKKKLSKGFLKKAPKICVPADFGRHFIGVPTHENLTFNLGDGVKIKANSIILALNSPVIDNLTTNLHQTSLEADDFCKEAVECFIESTYTGNIESLNLNNFRDLNKMSRVFKVSWLVAKCEKYFVSYLRNLDKESSYPDMMFAVDEAVYLNSAMKNTIFLNLVSKKMLSFPTSKRREFIQNYLSDFGKSSFYKIDACIAMVKTDVHILVELLIVHLKRNGNISLDVNSRHLLMNLDLTLCFFKRRDLHTELFDALESLTEVTKEDFKLFMHLHKQNTSVFNLTTPINTVLLDTSKLRIAHTTTVDNMLDELSADEDLTNLYSFIDKMWLSLKNSSITKNVLRSDCHATEKVRDIVKERGWSPVDRMYTTVRKQSNNVAIMFRKLNSCEKVVSKNSGASYFTVFEYSQPDFIRELFLRDNMFKFNIPGSYLFGDQTFVLLTSGVKKEDPNSFDLRWCLFDRPSEQSSISLPKLHFALYVHSCQGKKGVVPITWCGQPTNFELKKCWNWGYIRFHNHECEDKSCRGDSLTCQHIRIADIVKLVAFVI